MQYEVLESHWRGSGEDAREGSPAQHLAPRHLFTSDDTGERAKGDESHRMELSAASLMDHLRKAPIFPQCFCFGGLGMTLWPEAVFYPSFTLGKG